MVKISLNGNTKWALLDSGANPSIVYSKSLQSIGASYFPSPSRVFGVGATAVTTLWEADATVEMGEKHKLRHTFLVLDSSEPTIIGGDFLRRFSSTELTGTSSRRNCATNDKFRGKRPWSQPLTRAGTVTGIISESYYLNGTDPNDCPWLISPREECCPLVEARPEGSTLKAN